MMTTALMLRPTEARTVVVEANDPEYYDAAEALWQRTGARPLGHGDPTLRLVALEASSGKFLGVADYFRTFPPEDAIGGVAVVPDERRKGTGTLLLNALAEAAMRNGKRNLIGFMREEDQAAWHLLDAAQVLVRLYQVEGGFCVELDLLPRKAG